LNWLSTQPPGSPRLPVSRRSEHQEELRAHKATLGYNAFNVLSSGHLGWIWVTGADPRPRGRRTAPMSARPVERLEPTRGRTKTSSARSAGRVCASPDCNTVLSIYNPGEVCSVHDDQTERSATVSSQKKTVRRR
jgi:hypothetical protein